jgi:aspartate-semialdehyde dehydrogenase
MAKIRVALLGAAGVLGQRFLERLENHPFFDTTTLVDLMVGKRYDEATKWRLGSQMPQTFREMKIQSVDSISKGEVDLVFSALPGGLARQIELDLAKKGLFVVSKAKDLRMEPDVPLIVPEVNGDHLSLIKKQREQRGWKGAIVTDPNCSTTILAMSLRPLWDRFGVESVAVATMQSVSGAGYPGVPSLDIIDNVVPYISEEEDKMIIELKKLFGTESSPAQFSVAASCNRVSTIDGHMEAAFVRTKKKAQPEEVKKAFAEFKGLDLPSAPNPPIVVRKEPDRPQTRLDRDTGDGMSVVVGRIRSDEVFGLSYVVVGHNTIRGGAGGAVLVAELCHRNGFI